MAKGPLTVEEQSAHFLNRPHAREPVGPVGGASAWRCGDLPPVDGLKHRFTPCEIADLQRAIDGARNKPRNNLVAEDFAFGSMESVFEAWRRELQDGRGFVLAGGLQVAEWSREDLDLLMRGIGLQFGRLGAQNARGDVIGEVRNTGAAERDPFVRNYVTDREFRFHCDAADLLGLLCVRRAWRGGGNRLASSVTVFNELQKRRPDLASRLFQPVLLDLRNEQRDGAPAFGALTPCAYADGVLRTVYISDYFRSVDRHEGVELSEEERALLDLYEEIAGAPENCLRLNLDPGDMLLINNHVMLHARDAFEDAPGAERLLLRFLVSVGA